MSEVIVKLNSDRIKIKGGEYVQDLVRCRDCKAYDDIYNNPNYGICTHDHWEQEAGYFPDVDSDDYCSRGERKDQ